MKEGDISESERKKRRRRITSVCDVCIQIEEATSSMSGVTCTERD